MQEDALFKVPKTRRCLLNLFCKETLDDLEDVWNPTQRTNHVVGAHCNGSTSSECENVKTTCHLRENSHLNVSFHEKEVDNIDSLLQLDSWLSSGQDSDDSESDVCTDNSMDKYTKGLVDEFTASAFKEQSPADSDSDDVVTDMDNIMTSNSPVLLFLRDEAMVHVDSDSCGSHDYWDSVTPPVPGSPSDHVVPDSYNMYWSPVTSNQENEDHMVPDIDLLDSQNLPSG